MKKITLFYLFASIMVVLTIHACQRTSQIGHDKWTDRAMPGTALEKWFFSIDGSTWENVRIPHSYNSIDGQSKSYYRGEAHYRTKLPKAKNGNPRYIIFEGVGQSAYVLADDDTLGYHSGGYTPFYINITGKEFTHLEVICENRENLDRIPLTSDFNKNGGIHYPVWILECPEVHLAPETYGYYRIHVSTPSVSDSLASGTAKTMIRNTSADKQDVTVVWSLRDASGSEVLAHSEEVTLPAGTEKGVTWDFQLENPHLWNGLADPYL